MYQWTQTYIFQGAISSSIYWECVGGEILVHLRPPLSECPKECDFVAMLVVNHCFLIPCTVWNSWPWSPWQNVVLFSRVPENLSRTRCVALSLCVSFFFIIPQLKIMEWNSYGLSSLVFSNLFDMLWPDYFDLNQSNLLKSHQNHE